MNIYIWITVIGTFKLALLLFMLSFGSEKLFKTLKNCQSDILMLKESTGCPDKRSVYKTLSRASRVASNVISADSGIFTVDATLPLSLISVVATYSIVLLQFAFL
ncbi:uncharacterized protein [Battus philenor]|uniref:uncharacterized protein n=1 Tax=Battus philenor TaxID=42288 RepID=UPI0035CE918B